MASPAASSAARLMRHPEHSFSIAFAALADVAVRLRWELNASTLFWMRSAILCLLDVSGGLFPWVTPCRPRPDHRPVDGEPEDRLDGCVSASGRTWST